MLNLPTTASIAVLACALVVGAGRAHAQQSSQIALTGGVATDQRGVRSNAFTLAPSMSVDVNHRFSFQLGGSATRFATEAWSLGTTGSFGARETFARFFALTLNGSANASRLQGATVASFVQAEVVPAMELRAGRMTLFGGARAARGYAAEQSAQPGLPIGNTRGSTVSATRGAAGPLFGALLTFADDARSLQLGARDDRMRVAGIAIADRALSLSVSQGGVAMSLSGGSRQASDENVAFGSAGISVGLSPAVSLDVAAGRYPRNRLLGTPGGDFMSAGLSFRFGGGGREPSLPEARGPRPPERGTTRLTLNAPDARRVEVAGDFNDWMPAAASRAANGVWYVDLEIPPGQYRYAFRVNGIEWRVPHGATAVDDGFGGKSAWLTVRDTKSRS